MIFYTLQGPCYLAEIHDDKIVLKKRFWFKLISGPGVIETWKLEDLCQFSVNTNHPFFWGRLEWSTFAGERGALRYSTHPVMMKKIELYFQKRILKNHQQHFALENKSKEKKQEVPNSMSLAA